MTIALAPNDLAVYPEVGLILFFVVFVAVTVRALRRTRPEVSRWARLPLEDGPGEAGRDAPESRRTER